MSKLKNMRLIEIPRFRAVSSGEHTLEEIFEPGGFCEWCGKHPELMKRGAFEAEDLLWHENNDINRSVLIWAIRDEVTEEDVKPYEIMEFMGGMYLVATADENDDADLNETVSGMFQWIDECEVLERGDYPVSGMCNMPNPDGALDKALGIAQQQIYLPVKIK